LLLGAGAYAINHRHFSNQGKETMTLQELENSDDFPEDELADIKLPDNLPEVEDDEDADEDDEDDDSEDEDSEEEDDSDDELDDSDDGTEDEDDDEDEEDDEEDDDSDEDEEVSVKQIACPYCNKSFAVEETE